MWSFYSFCQPISLDGSDTLKAAIHLFHQQLQWVLKEETANESALTSVLSMLIHLDPFQTVDSGELGFSWIAEILNSRYGEQREWMAGQVVQSLGRHFFRTESVSFVNVELAWIPPLLGFLSLSEKLDTTRSSGFIALRILATSPGSAAFGPMLLPILHSTLLPTDRLHARCLALNVFLRFMSGWFSSKVEGIPSEDLDKLVQAVDDPFQFPNLPLRDGKPVHPPDYDPMMATAVLIEFASSDLWRNNLRRSNFASCEEILSTWDGKKTALRCMLDMAIRSWPEFLCTAAKITMAIGRLEELQCLNTAEVVIMWAWILGVVNPVDHNAWEAIERDTLRFCRTHGTERLIALKRHITDTSMAASHIKFLQSRFWSSSSGVGGIRQPLAKPQARIQSRYHTVAPLYISRACQLRRLDYLFGYDSTTWKEAVAVAVEEAAEEMDVSVGCSVTPVPFMDYACDYP